MGVTKKKPKVSVCVVTYNQEKYIRQCLQSIVDQKTNFDFDVIVADDCSRDDTSTIVREFAEKYPGVVKPIFHEKNIGAYKNFIFAHENATGEYTSHVDGDDYCLPGKLQNQVNFLDKNPGFALVAHKMEILNDQKIIGRTQSNPEIIEIGYLLQNHPAFLNSSTMMRRGVWQSLPRRDLLLDFHIYIHACMCGAIGFQNIVLGVYRQGIGISSSRNLLPQVMDAIDSAKKSSAPRIDDFMRAAKAKNALSYSFSHLLKRDYDEFSKSILIAWNFGSNRFFVWFFYKLRKNPVLLRQFVVLYKKIK